MWDFIKKIFSERDGDVTVIVLDENEPDGSSSFKLRAIDIVKITLLVMFVSVAITTIMFFATPLGSLYQHQQDESLRRSVVQISDRVSALQDSLIARDIQLRDMRDILRTTRDTIFQVEVTGEMFGLENGRGLVSAAAGLNAYEMLSPNEILQSGVMSQAPDFPANFPVRGTLTQGYSAEDGHYGLDIAARPGTEFYVLADGTVLDEGWTINYGYVIYVQHANGIMTVYKHAARLAKSKGDYVLKGDILGTIGDSGVLSTGSHLHLEIWKNGVPQNPSMYLLN